MMTPEKDVPITDPRWHEDPDMSSGPLTDRTFARWKRMGFKPEQIQNAPDNARTRYEQYLRDHP